MKNFKQKNEISVHLDPLTTGLLENFTKFIFSNKNHFVTPWTMRELAELQMNFDDGPTILYWREMREKKSRIKIGEKFLALTPISIYKICIIKTVIGERLSLKIRTHHIEKVYNKKKSHSKRAKHNCSKVNHVQLVCDVCDYGLCMLIACPSFLLKQIRISS